MTTQQAADALDCTTSQVRQLAREGRLQQRQLSPRVVLYDPEDVARLAAEKAGRQRLPKRPRR